MSHHTGDPPHWWGQPTIAQNPWPAQPMYAPLDAASVQRLADAITRLAAALEAHNTHERYGVGNT